MPVQPPGTEDDGRYAEQLEFETGHLLSFQEPIDDVDGCVKYQAVVAS